VTAPILPCSPLGSRGRERGIDVGERRRSLLGIALLLGMFVAPLLSPSVVRAQTIIVHSGDVQGLKSAIIALNAASGANTIALDPTGDYNLTASDNGAVGDETGLPVITGNITITGSHPTIRRDSVVTTPRFRLFAVASGGTLHLDDVILSNGAVRGSNGLDGFGATTFDPNGGPGFTGITGVGGAVKNDGALIVSKSLFTGNSAIGGSGGNGAPGRGGCTCVGGNGGRGGVGGDGLGGAIYSTGSLAVINSTFTTDTAIGGHGGTGGDAGTGTNGSGTPGNGGDGGNGGGAIATTGGGTITNVTIAANTGNAGAAGQAGSGAISTASAGFGTGGVNLGGGTTLVNAILASNAGSAANRANCAAALGAHDGGHNLEFNPTTSCGLNTGSPQFDVLADPKLSAMTIFDFISTPYFSISSGTAAMGAGDAIACTGAIVAGVDQRGKPRTGTTCDIGAVEAQGSFVTGSLPTTFTAGVPFAINIQIVSEFGGLLTKYAGTLHTFNADPLGGTPADFTFTRSDGGVHDFPITFADAGDWSVIISEKATSIAVFAQTFAVAPAFVRLSPSFGSPSGGTTVTLTGAGFVTGLTTVTFGSTTATITSISNTGVTVTTPAHAEGTVAVTVVSNGHGARTSAPYGYGTLTPLPNPKLPGSYGGAPNPLPAPRLAGQPSGSSPPAVLPMPRQ
jgi:hypothetical protein